MRLGRNNLSRLPRPDVLCVTCLHFAASCIFFPRPILLYDLSFGLHICGCSPATFCNLALLPVLHGSTGGTRAKLRCSAGFAVQQWKHLGNVLVSMYMGGRTWSSEVQKKDTGGGWVTEFKLVNDSSRNDNFEPYNGNNRTNLKNGSVRWWNLNKWWKTVLDFLALY